MLFPDGPKARKGRRFARKIFRILNVSKGAIDMILYGQRYKTQRRYYYAMEKLKKWTKIHHCTILDLKTMKPYISLQQRHRFKEQPHAPVYQESNFSTYNRQTEVRRHMERGNTI
ncbi:MAG: hypothetical protein EZS28_014646 [Streblomastix strix]|uniref:Uncharacterized protein n=1 Tax=Streblomastix strix TaxID=222440 RepID=A0A5J4W4P7_9EUKA|nr:MAG: hypothetical protein EZS28_014646 [Streblomastix strix]